MTTEPKPSAGNTLVFAIVGIGLMLLGTYLYNEKTFSAIEEPLAASGIPLKIGMTIATVGVFLILFKLIESFFIIPLREAIQNRTHELERTFSEVETLRSEMTAMRTDYERKLVQTEAEARERIQAQIAEAQNLRQSLMSDAGQRAEELVAKASQEIEAEKAKALVELRTYVVDIALAAAEKVVGENMDNERNRRLVSDFVQKVEVAS
jgi:F-type H+-transporting ATPase subunit b